jgi:hypothetical protein
MVKVKNEAGAIHGPRMQPREDVDVGVYTWTRPHMQACNSFVPCKEAEYPSNGNLQLDKAGNGGKVHIPTVTCSGPFPSILSAIGQHDETQAKLCNFYKILEERRHFTTP